MICKASGCANEEFGLDGLCLRHSIDTGICQVCDTAISASRDVCVSCNPFLVKRGLIYYRQNGSEEPLNGQALTDSIIELVFWARAAYGNRYWQVTAEACEWIDLGTFEEVRHGVLMLSRLRFRNRLEQGLERLIESVGEANGFKKIFARLEEAEELLRADRLGQAKQALGEVSRSLNAIEILRRNRPAESRVIASSVASMRARQANAATAARVLTASAQMTV
jgi:hypothetical protein